MENAWQEIFIPEKDEQLPSDVLPGVAFLALLVRLVFQRFLDQGLEVAEFVPDFTRRNLLHGSLVETTLRQFVDALVGGRGGVAGEIPLHPILDEYGGASSHGAVP